MQRQTWNALIAVAVLLSVMAALTTVLVLAVDLSSPTVVTTNGSTADLFAGRVKLPNGMELRGEQYWQADNGEEKAFAYYGYKYGTANRFEASIANTNFSYYMYRDNDTGGTHSRLGHACPQIISLTAPIPFGTGGVALNTSEDCLFLDVYLPPIKRDETEAWPVLLWIHGGSFRTGNKDMYNASILARAVNAVVVVVNYRLGVFGFLSTADDTARGNWAIGDLKLAVNWTIANAAAFNGDPARLTIVGGSAGAALTSALMLDDDVRGKVQVAVAMSGSILSPWAVVPNPKTMATQLAADLGCPTSTVSAEIVQCLKKQPVDRVLSSSLSATVTGGIKRMFAFAPVVDGIHVPKAPIEVLRERANRPKSAKPVGRFIAGYLKDDSSVFLEPSPSSLATLNITLASQILSGILQWAYRTPICLATDYTQLQGVFEFYNISQSSSDVQLRQGISEITTDVAFGIGTLKESQIYAGETDSDNQMYFISYSADSKAYGAFHTLDTMHMFRGQMDRFLEGNLSEALTTSMHNFIRQIVHEGKATGHAYGVEGHYRELNQQIEWTERKRNSTDMLLFWDRFSASPCSTEI
ncbi:putative Neuroligin-1 [Hypsibius exemplaris]|uniref:Neuroligin-1 n=1 Tax=Hypsibius exemplaris TaxID=2072580 RepID=A0A1W0WWH1_HYPEX|nr:putative Neuroligin-1 [Hypsibius exemplaris]